MATRAYKKLIWQDPERVSGAVCFYGTRIPVDTMFDYLRNGESLAKFAADYGVSLGVAQGVVDVAAKGLDRLLDAA